MKKIGFILIILLGVLNLSCSDYLDVVPDNVATINYAFYDRVGAEKYLATCYSYLPAFGSPINDVSMMGSDELTLHKDLSTYGRYFGAFNPYKLIRGQQNVDNPHCDYWEGRNSGHSLFQGIRDCNVFLENIDKVGKDLQEWERKRWVAEVKFLKAYYHYYLLRMYGPIPLMRENANISLGVEEIRAYRDPFDEGIDYVVELLDEAAVDLPLQITNAAIEYGRITKPAALAIKAEVLVTAASPLFNGNEFYSNFTDARGIELFNTAYDSNKWKIAMEACKNAIDTALLANHQLYVFQDPNYPVSDETRLVQSCRGAFTERFNLEVIWGGTKNTMDNTQFSAMPTFTMDDVQNIGTGPIISPTLRMAELYYSNNGVPINEDKTYDYVNRYKTSFADNSQRYYITNNFKTANLHQSREPRFYANLGFDGGIWFGNGRYKDVDMGSASETSWILRTKRGDPSGKTQSIRFYFTGYAPKKYAHFESAHTGRGRAQFVRMSYPIMRLSDLYLLYAESRNEYLGPDDEVHFYIDEVRNRAGLEGVKKSWESYSVNPNKPNTQDGLREIIRHERMIELSFEGKRFWDIRRWKIAGDLYNKPVKGWNVEGSSAMEYYNIITLEKFDFQTKHYLWPIREHQLQVNPKLVQNPFWDN